MEVAVRHDSRREHDRSQSKVAAAPGRRWQAAGPGRCRTRQPSSPVQTRTSRLFASSPRDAHILPRQAVIARRDVTKSGAEGTNRRIPVMAQRLRRTRPARPHPRPDHQSAVMAARSSAMSAAVTTLFRMTRVGTAYTGRGQRRGGIRGIQRRAKIHDVNRLDRRPTCRERWV